MVKIVIDSTAGMERDQAKELDISVVSLKILFSDGEYEEGFPENYSFFYDKIDSTGEFPKTSLPSPETFSEVFKKHTDNGDEVVCITISSALSGTYNSAKKAAENFDGKVFVVDSKNCCQNIVFLAEEATELAKKGYTAAQIKEELKVMRDDLCMKFVPESLDYLKKGGRISLLSASLGSILKIKPILQFKDGILTNSKKVIGMGKAVSELVKHLGENAKKIYVCKIGSSAHFETFLTKVKEKFSSAIIKIGEISPVMGAHVGPGTLGIAAI